MGGRAKDVWEPPRKTILFVKTIFPTSFHDTFFSRIPQDLSWDVLRSFHSRHYSPRNARFLSYGSLPLEGHLEAVDPYMPKEGDDGDSVRPVPEVPSEPRWQEPRKAEIR